MREQENQNCQCKIISGQRDQFESEQHQKGREERCLHLLREISPNGFHRCDEAKGQDANFRNECHEVEKSQEARETQHIKSKRVRQHAGR